jgi:hypothetical protein
MTTPAGGGDVTPASRDVVNERLPSVCSLHRANAAGTTLQAGKTVNRFRPRLAGKASQTIDRSTTMATRPFFDTLREIRRGQILDDCADELAKAVRAVDETGKAAKLTIELSIKPAAKIPGTYVISDKVRAKLPELPVGETILYGTPEGNLQARDPRQADLELKAVSAEPAMQPESLRKVG